jgi:hypothetical protein
MKHDFKKFLDLPSKEHRGHIRRFLRLDFTDEQDVALRGLRAFKIWLFTANHEAGDKRRPNHEGE